MNRKHIEIAISCLRDWDKNYHPETLELDMGGWSSLGPDNSCLTSLCAAGYLTQCPRMRELGLRAQRDYVGSSYCPRYQEWSDFDALMHLFDLSYEQLTEVFGWHCPFTRPGQAADAFERVMREAANA